MVILGVYLAVGRSTSPIPGSTLETLVDRAVPLSPAWVFVYAAVYLQVLAPVCTLTHPRVLDRTILGFLSIYLVAVPIWWFWPFSAPIREPLVLSDVSSYVLGMVRAIDPVTNCFPSMHVAFATLAALVVVRHDPPIGKILFLTTALISASTLLVEQHWLADCVLGAALAVIADRIWLSRLEKSCFAPLPRAWHSVWVGLYLTLALGLMSSWWLGWMPLEWIQAPVVRPPAG